MLTRGIGSRNENIVFVNEDTAIPIRNGNRECCCVVLVTLVYKEKEHVSENL